MHFSILAMGIHEGLTQGNGQIPSQGGKVMLTVLHRAHGSGAGGRRWVSEAGFLDRSVREREASHCWEGRKEGNTRPQGCENRRPDPEEGKK